MVPEKFESVPPIVYVFVVHEMLTPITFALPITPIAPELMVQVWLGELGCDRIVTS